MAIVIGIGDYASLTSRGYFKAGQDANGGSPTIEAECTPWLDAWGETVTYTPRDGVPREVLAFIDRLNESGASGLGPAAMETDADLHVCNEAKSILDDGYGGISESEVDTGGDTITYPVRRGGPTKTRSIDNVPHSDNGMLIVKLR